MHGRKRAEMRARSNAFIASIEHFRQQNRFGRIFTLIDLKEKQSLDLSSLVVAGNVVVNPQRIHALLTDHFQSWYATPCNLHPIAKNFLAGNFWHQLVTGTSEDIPDNCFPPSFMLPSFIAACKSKVSIEQVDCIASANLLLWLPSPGKSTLTRLLP